MSPRRVDDSILTLHHGEAVLADYSVALTEQGWSVTSIGLSHPRELRRWTAIPAMFRNRPTYFVAESGTLTWNSLLFMRALLLACAVLRVRPFLRHSNCAWIWAKRTRPRMHWIRWALFVRTLARFEHLAISDVHAKDLQCVLGVSSRVIGLYSEKAERLSRCERTPTADEHRPVIVNFSSAQERKGTDLFVEIARRVKAEIPEARFVWMGSAGLKTDFRRRVVPAGSDVVEFLPHQDPGGLQLSATLLLFTSRSEAGGRAVVESLAAGLPVVCFSGTGPQDFVGDAGSVVDGHDLDGVVVRVLDILRMKPEERSALHEAAASRYRSELSKSPAVERLIGALRS